MHVVYVGYPGFPLGHAQVERQKLIAKGLVACGCEVTVISRNGIFDKQDVETIPESGLSEGIRFKYASGIRHRPSNFLVRNYFKAKGLLNELCLIYKFRSSRKLDAVIITTNSFYNVLLYSCMSYLCGAPSILDNVEYWSSRSAHNIWAKLDHRLYDKYAYKLATKVICISDFLLNIVKAGSPGKPTIKIPAIVDYSKFPNRQVITEPYYLFCGSGTYFDIIDFIIEAYEKLGQNTYKLYIVSNGSEQELYNLRNRIALSTKRDCIQHYTDLSYDKLTQLYHSSKALLIPLLDREQDIARFPHKIGEYCASARVIITTNIGEITSYFKDSENALIAEVPTTTIFAEKMQYVIDYPEAAAMLGEKSYTTGIMFFNYAMLGRKILDFLVLPQDRAAYSPYATQAIEEQTVSG